ncbi:hypothetical protein [Mycobacterium sp.]|uniref:hypothetical protein n=1 Tax=Mycobacterium sp. TaxID=1785 RepID=UPI0031D201FF
MNIAKELEKYFGKEELLNNLGLTEEEYKERVENNTLIDILPDDIKQLFGLDEKGNDNFLSDDYVENDDTEDDEEEEKPTIKEKTKKATDNNAKVEKAIENQIINSVINSSKATAVSIQQTKEQLGDYIFKFFDNTGMKINDMAIFVEYAIKFLLENFETVETLKLELDKSEEIIQELVAISSDKSEKERIVNNYIEQCVKNDTIPDKDFILSLIV